MDGIYGTTRPASIDPLSEADIFYSYKPNRSYVSKESERFFKLDSNILFPSEYDEKSKIKRLDGMYNLRLPIQYFNKKGVYTIYIRPREILTNIVDVSILFTYPDIRGVVFNLDEINNVFKTNISTLTGYRMDFVDESNNKTGSTRLITSSNRAVPKTTSVNDKYANDTRYAFSDTVSPLVFCTVTPSLANSFQPNSLPYIGESGSKVCLTNTNFNPVMLEIELVDHDIETLTNSIEGSQVRDLDRGKIVTFNDKNEIYSYHEYFTLKDKLGNPLYDVKVKQDNFDENGTTYKELIKE